LTKNKSKSRDLLVVITLSKYYNHRNVKSLTLKINLENLKSFENPASKGTYKETTITLFKSFIGSGVIAMPYSFYIGGYMLSSIIFALVAILINYSQVMVVRLAEAC
jgi:hypothetical protein